jgi:hypothetical protein
MPEPILMKLGTYIIASEPLSTAYPPIVARQRLGKNVTVAKNTHATIEELLNASFSVGSVSYQREVGDQFFPEFVFIFRLMTVTAEPLYIAGEGAKL